jgi:hypothetical protein
MCPAVQGTPAPTPTRCQHRLAALGPRHHPAGMFVVTEADAAAIRAAFEQSGELSAAIELRRLFPGITDNALARECARTIAAWKPLVTARDGSQLVLIKFLHSLCGQFRQRHQFSSPPGDHWIHSARLGFSSARWQLWLGSQQHGPVR